MPPPLPRIPGAPLPSAAEPRSAFALAIEEAARSRPVEVFDVSGLFRVGEKELPRIGIRVPTKGEQDRALVAAHKYVAAIAGEVAEAKGDRDILQDAKAAAVAFEFAREVHAPTCTCPTCAALPPATDPTAWRPTGYPAFPGQRWAIDHLTTEQIAVLINLANEWRAKQAPSPTEIDDVTIEAYASLCSTAEEPEYAMAGLGREYLVQLAILLSHKLVAARRRAEGLVDELAALRAPSAPPPADDA